MQGNETCKIRKGEAAAQQAAHRHEAQKGGGWHCGCDRQARQVGSQDLQVERLGLAMLQVQANQVGQCAGELVVGQVDGPQHVLVAWRAHKEAGRQRAAEAVVVQDPAEEGQRASADKRTGQGTSKRCSKDMPQQELFPNRCAPHAMHDSR